MVARALPPIRFIPLHRAEDPVALLLLEELRATERFIDGYYQGRCNPRGFVALDRESKPLGYVLYHQSAHTIIVDALTVDDEGFLTVDDEGLKKDSIIEMNKLLLERVKGELSAACPKLLFPTRCAANETHVACVDADMALMENRLNYFSDGDTACCYEYHLPVNPAYAPPRRFEQQLFSHQRDD